MYERFKCEDGVYRAYVQCPSELLDTEIPEGVKWSGVVLSVDEDGVETTRQKTLREFVLTHLITYMDDGTTIFPLAAMERPVTRQKAVNEEDMGQWDAFLTPYGYDSSKWLTIAERNAMMPEEEI